MGMLSKRNNYWLVFQKETDNGQNGVIDMNKSFFTVA